MTVVLTCGNDACIYNDKMSCTCDYVELDFTGECQEFEEMEEEDEPSGDYHV